jgi:transcriptional regulator with XRE-family HTH domain
MQQDIAATLGVGESTISAWKRGTPPRAENIVAAARAYDVDASELFRIAFLDDEEPEKESPKAPRPKKPRPKIPLQPRQDMPPY